VVERLHQLGDDDDDDDDVSLVVFPLDLPHTATA